MKSILLCIAVLAVLALTKPQAPKAPQPDMIVELFRHGARGPLGTYDLSWPVSEYGMLTPVGLRQQYILGKVLSEKYPDLIGSTYNYSNIYMITDTTPRCVQSAGGQLYGMYLGKGPALPSNSYPPELAIPPFKDPRVDVIADSLPDSEALPHNFVPGIIEIVDATSAFIFQGDQSDYCPNQNVWSAINGNDTLFQQAMQVFGETIANVNNLLPENEQLTTQEEIWTFGDTLLVDLYDNRTLPAGITDPQLITNITWAFTWFTYHWWDGQLEQRQTGAFNLIEAILQQLADYRQGNVTTTAALFSGHDDNIFALLGVFGIVNEQCIFDNFASVLENGTLVHPLCYYPYFASDMIFEFYNDTENPYVQVFYNNEIIPICNGQSNCSYDEFVTFARSSVGNLTLESYFHACGTNSSYLKEQFGILNYTFPQPDLSFVMSKNSPIQTEMIAAIVLAIICVMLVTKIVFDKKKYTEELKAARESVLYEKIASF